MFPLIIPAAVSLANVAITKAVSGADFQQSLNTAAARAVTAAQEQQAAAMPGQIHTVAQQILQAPDVQSMARTSPSASVNLQFNSSGALFATQAGGGVRQLAISPEVRQELQQLNNVMRHSAVGAYGSTAQVAGQIGSSQVPVQVTLAAV
jgi:hypothetical protein